MEPAVLGSRSWVYVWAVLGCPVIGWWTAVHANAGDADTAEAVFRFVGVPALLAVVGAFVFGGRLVDAVVGAILAGVLGALTVLLTFLALGHSGYFV
jgi:hypothetical protein